MKKTQEMMRLRKKILAGQVHKLMLSQNRLC